MQIRGDMVDFKEFITKKELLLHLANVKLLIGNGFDLYCNLNTRYVDFFVQYNYIYERIHDWSRNVYQNNLYTHPFNIRGIDKQTNCNLDENTTIWDLYFYYNIINFNEESLFDDYSEIQSDYYWCDIELMIKKSLSNKDRIKSYDKNNILWIKLCNYMDKKQLNNLNIFEQLCFFFYNIRKQDESFINFLFHELVRFEKRFGTYIKNEEKSDDYQTKAIACLNKLIDVSIKTNFSIDSFNYTSISSIVNFKHINGDTDNPIFGIDSTNEEKFKIFTKDYRRFKLLSTSNNFIPNSFFENLIIFGHSLNEQDFNYYFSLFDQLKILNVDSNFKIIFVYKLYRNTEKENNKLLEELMIKIILLFENYEMERTNNNNYRLFGRLNNQNKILLINIDDDF